MARFAVHDNESSDDEDEDDAGEQRQLNVYHDHGEQQQQQQLRQRRGMRRQEEEEVDRMEESDEEEEDDDDEQERANESSSKLSKWQWIPLPAMLCNNNSNRAAPFIRCLQSVDDGDDNNGRGQSEALDDRGAYDSFQAYESEKDDKLRFLRNVLQQQERYNNQRDHRDTGAVPLLSAISRLVTFTFSILSLLAFIALITRCFVAVFPSQSPMSFLLAANTLDHSVDGISHR
jgi:hypothetical protein